MDPGPAEQLLRVSQLSWQVKDKTILDKLTFSVRQGEFVGIIGPNGAGKSSLLRCLYGVNRPSAGQIFVAEKNIQDYSRRQMAQQIAVVLQEPPSRFDIQVKDVIRMGLTPHKKLLSFDTNEDDQAVNQAARKVDLFDKLQQQFNSLSGGEKQRAMIARAIVQRPTILLMDEPTNHLDIRHQLEVLDLAKSMGITVIVSIHDLNLASAFCNRLILLDEGKIIEQGTPGEVLTETNLKQVFAVKAAVDTHPFNQQLRITFNFGKQLNG